MSVSTRSSGIQNLSIMPSVGGGSAVKMDYFQEASPVATSDRMLVQDSTLSLVVKDVSQAVIDIEAKAKEFGGYLVDSSLNIPESAASGSIIVRIPEEKRAQALSIFKSLGVKVVSENIHGTDVTDEYVDLESRLDILYQTKTKYQSIMDKAVSVTDLMNVQRELINLQAQIDNLKGQQKYYEQSAKLSRVLVYLSTDELALPYSPSTEWRPAVVFKTAVRSLVSHVRSLGSLLIWIVVYLPILALGYLGYRLIKKYLSNKNR